MSTANERTRVVILKWDRTYRDALRWVVQRFWPSAEVFTFERGAEALAEIQARGADLLITGVKIIDMDGLEHLEPLVEKPIKIVVVTARRDEWTYQLLKRVRFDAIYDSANEGLEKIPDCLETVMAGRMYVSPTLQECLVVRKRLRNDDVLTASEELVLSAIGDGADDNVAAAKLAKSEETIHVHRRSIMRKLRLHHRGELVCWAVQRGYLVIDERGVHRPGFQRVLAKQSTVAPAPVDGGSTSPSKRAKNKKNLAGSSRRGTEKL